MNNLHKHLRNTFLAGIFGAIPIAITAYVIWLLWGYSDLISEKVFHRRIPFIGVVLVLVVIYLLGLLATSLIGKFFLRLIDKLLTRVPLVRELYTAWKQIALTPGGTEGIYSRVVLVPGESKDVQILGFSTGKPIGGDPGTLCVFVPSAPNPTNGRIVFVHRDSVKILNISTEDAFKIILSTGNYVPTQVGQPTLPLQRSEVAIPS